MTADAPPKLCFVISAIGAKDSPDRVRADWLLHNVVRPVLEHDPFKYIVRRTDEIADPGLITDQVITSVENAELVVADLTAGPAGFNANVFYELGIRHMSEASSATSTPTRGHRRRSIR